ETAIAVHPDDAQCKHLHGEFAIHPSIPGRKMPIITDAEAVDMEFVTGAVKITPAHDPNDYAVGTRHNLAFINTLNDDGTLNENAGEKFAGMPRFKVRVEVVKALEAAGLFVEKKDNPMQIPICRYVRCADLVAYGLLTNVFSKSGNVIEPIPKPRW
ncbi:hypothetical protein K523DRAFT_257146, partial [Schizophyllum commune Tattone D]